MKQQVRKTVKNILIIILPIAMSIFSGIYANQLFENLTEENSLWVSIQNTGLSWPLIITLLLLFIYLMISLYPNATLKKQKEKIINNLLGAITTAIFHTYSDLDISAVVQICNIRKKKRIVKYYYNTDPNLRVGEDMCISFGDIGETCVAQKSFLIKDCSLDDWKNGSDEYKKVVPRNLRLIVGEPILDEKRNVIAVLELDVFESTKESAKGDSKVGYITDNITVEELKQTLNKRNVKVLLGEWASPIGILIENL